MSEYNKLNLIAFVCTSMACVGCGVAPRVDRATRRGVVQAREFERIVEADARWEHPNVQASTVAPEALRARVSLCRAIALVGTVHLAKDLTGDDVKWLRSQLLARDPVRAGVAARILGCAGWGIGSLWPAGVRVHIDIGTPRLALLRRALREGRVLATVAAGVPWFSMNW